MKTEKIAYDNGLFMILRVGQCIGMRSFAGAVLESRFQQMAQFPTDNAGAPGYIRVNYSAVKEVGLAFQEKFEEKIRDGLFEKVAFGFSSRTEFEGDLADKTTIRREGYEFVFEIREYERDSSHGFEIVGPEMLQKVPNKEELGRVVYLTIKPEGLFPDASVTHENATSVMFDKSIFLTALTAQCQAVNLEALQKWEVSIEPKVFAASIRTNDSGEWPTIAFYFDEREVKLRDDQSGARNMAREIQLLMLTGFTVEKLNHIDPESNISIAYFEGNDPIQNEPMNIVNYASQLFARVDNGEVGWCDSAIPISSK